MAGEEERSPPRSACAARWRARSALNAGHGAGGARACSAPGPHSASTSSSRPGGDHPALRQARRHAWRPSRACAGTCRRRSRATRSSNVDEVEREEFGGADTAHGAGRRTTRSPRRRCRPATTTSCTSASWCSTGSRTLRGALPRGRAARDILRDAAQAAMREVVGPHDDRRRALRRRAARWRTRRSRSCCSRCSTTTRRASR